MSKQYAKKQPLEKTKNIFLREREKPKNTNIFSKNLKKVYPIGLHRTLSPLSLSSLSLSLSQNSTDSSSVADSSTSLEQKISLALHLIAPPTERREVTLPKPVPRPSMNENSDEGPRRCNWITRNSGKICPLVPCMLCFFYFCSSACNEQHNMSFCATLTGTQSTQ